MNTDNYCPTFQGCNQNDDVTGYLFSECMKKIADKEMPSDDEIEAANLELENLGLKICKTS